MNKHSHFPLRFFLMLMLLSVVFPTVSAQTEIFKETFEKLENSKGGNDGFWNYLSLIPTTPDKACVVEGWTFNDYVYEGKQCVCISGKDGTKGSATTPALGTAGDLTITFRAGGYDTTAEHLTMELAISGGGTLSKTKFKLTKGAFDTYSAQISGATSETKITFKSDSECKEKTSNRYFLDDVVVTVGQSTSKIDPALAFETSTCDAVVRETGTEIKTPLLTFNAAVSAADITFTSSNQEVVKDANIKNGSVVADGFGTTVITANYPGNEEFGSGSASYTLAVSKASATQTVFRKVTSVTSGRKYVIVANFDGVYYALQNGSYKALKLDFPVYEDGFTTDNFDHVFTIAGKPDAYTLQQTNGRYVGWSSGTSLNFAITNADEKKALWKFVDDNGTLRIINQGEGRYLELTKNTDYEFRLYDGPMPQTALPSLYEMAEVSALGQIEVKAQEGFGTFYGDRAITLPEGLQATTVQGVDDKGKLRLDWEFKAGDAIPARTGILVYAANVGSYPYFAAPAEPAPLQTTNYLYGTLADELITEPADCKYYQLTYGEIEGVRTFGFFFGEEGGAAFTNQANKAYLALPPALQSAVKGFDLTPGGVIEGIETPACSQRTSPAVYTLTGVRIPAAKLGQLPRGIYIVNGQKTIVP